LVTSLTKIAVALDARMSEVYWGVYEQGVLMSERLAKPDGVDTLSDEFIGVGK
jgi:tRNA threonylcarbamoyladenosine biosynthesis protein TsaB